MLAKYTGTYGNELLLQWYSLLLNSNIYGKQAILAEEHTLILSERLLQRILKLKYTFIILECLELVEFMRL